LYGLAHHYSRLSEDERRVVDFAVLILFRKAKENTVSDEAMMKYVAYVTRFCDQMALAKAAFDKVAPHHPERTSK